MAAPGEPSQPSPARTNSTQARNSRAHALGKLTPYIRPYRWRLVVVLLALAVASASLLAVPQLAGRLIDRLSAGLAFDTLGWLPWSIALIVVIFAISSALRTYMVVWLGERIIADIRGRVHGHLLDLPVEFFESRATGELLSRISNDITALQSIISIVLIIGLRSFFQLTGSLAMMASTSLTLTGLVLVIGLPVAGVAKWFGRIVRERAVENREKEAAIVTVLEETLNGIDTIKAFAGQDREREHFNRLIIICFDSAARLVSAKAVFTLFIILAVFGAAGTISLLGIWQVFTQQLTGGTLAEFLLYMWIAGFAVVGLSEIHGEVKKASGTTDRLFKILDEPSELSLPARSRSLPKGRGAIHIDGVWFGYPARPSMPVLQDFNLKIGSGELVALVGPTGAGKTTLFRLLLAFYAPTAGSIKIDGLDIGTIDVNALRQEIGLVSQEPVIFSGSAMENIRYGRLGASDREVVEAAALAQIDKFLSSLPRGYDTALGHKGFQLSSGQRQRIAIARAILRRPRVMLLDEASSFIDIHSEALLLEAIIPFLRERTTILISHKPSFLQAADRIVSIDQGRVVAQADHVELEHYSSLLAHLLDR